MMLKTLQTILCVSLLAFTVGATDVTIGSTTQPNFNPTGLQAAVTLNSVTVTNGTNALLTCAACFRPNWVGMGGFYITVGVQNYYVKNVDSTSQVTLASSCPESSPATVTWHPYVEFRVYADRAFQPLGKNYIVQPGTPGTGAWYKRYGASVITVSGVRTLYIPELVIDATTDAVGPTNQARYTAAFYRPDGSLVQIYACADQFRVPPVTPTSWVALCQYNSPPAIVPPANEAYTKTQIDSRLITCSTGQMIYYAATGNQPSCLTVGTGLTITNGSILTIGGTRQVINAADYGCDLADNGNDDTTCVQNAINASRASSGQLLYLPTGTYNVSSINVSLNNMTIEGDGATKSIIKARQNDVNVFNIDGLGWGYRVTLRDFGVQGRGKATGNTGHCIYVNDSNSYVSEFHMSRLEISNCRGDAIRIPYMFSGIIERVTTDQIGGNHFDITAQGGTNTITLIGNYVKTVEAYKVGYRIRAGGVTMIGNNGMAPDSAGTAFWGVFGQKTATVSAVVTSGNAVLAGQSSVTAFQVLDEVVITNGKGIGQDLITNITAINTGTNQITVATAPTYSSTTTVASTDGPTSYYRGAFIGNNIEDFGAIGIRLKEGSRFGSISGNSFLTSPANVTHVAMKYDYAGAGYGGDGSGTTPSGFYDQSNTLTLQGTGSWLNSAAIHSQGVPFIVTGESPTQYYELSFSALVDLPAFSAAWDSVFGKMFLRLPNFRTDNLKLRTVTFSGLGALASSAGVMLVCTDCKPNSSTGTCEGSGNGSLAMGIGGAWKCN